MQPFRPQDQMVTRLPQPAASAPPAPPGQRIRPGRPPFEIIIPGEDGKPLLRMTETEDGRLDAWWDAGRTTEAVQRFLYQMLQWSGQVGLNWKEAVAEAAEGPVR